VERFQLGEMAATPEWDEKALKACDSLIEEEF
jgi:hypothetical protein